MKTFALILACFLPGIGHATIQGLYHGNTSPGQLQDSSGNGRTLIQVGTVPNPSSPTVPEGDRWLGGPFSTSNYYTAPTTVYTINQGVIAFWIRNHSLPSFDNQPIITVKGIDTCGNSVDVFRIGFDSSSRLRVCYNRSGCIVGVPTYDTKISTFVPTSATNYYIRIEYRNPQGITLRVNGVDIGGSQHHQLVVLAQ